MPLTFRKSFRILPGVRLNINRRSWSITSGGRNGPRPHTAAPGRRTTRWICRAPSAGAAPRTQAPQAPAETAVTRLRTPRDARISYLR